MEMIFHLVFVLFSFYCHVALVQGFIYPIKDKMHQGFQLRYSEGHLFASNAGPPLLQNGVSFLELDVVITIYSKTNMVTNNLELMIYRTNEEHKDDDLEGICRGDMKALKNNYWIDYLEFTKFKSSDAGKGAYTDDFLGFHNSTFYRHTAEIKKKVYIEKEGWYNVDLVICNVEYQPYPGSISTSSIATEAGEVVTVARLNPSRPSSKYQLLLQSPESAAQTGAVLSESHYARIDGDVKFKNPYGYLPAEYYGLLPFEAARLLAYVLLITWFMYIYSKNRDTVLNVHSALLIVFSLALIESVFWTSTYLDINISGEAFCCPYPPLVITSFVLQVIRQTFARTLLLVVSLGYGIVRPKLLTSEWTAIVIVTVLYFFSALAEQIDVIVLGNTKRLTEEQSKNNSVLLIPEFIMDVIFLTWIYFSITSTIRILTQFKQTEKLKIYEYLISIIGLFVILFSMISIIVILDDSHMIDWPWQLTWMQQAIWELLNFSVLAAIAIVTKPNENSRTLAYSSQIPTDEPTELEMTSHGFGADHPDDSDDEDDDVEEYDLVGASRYPPKKQALNGRLNGKDRGSSLDQDDSDNGGVKRKSVSSTASRGSSGNSNSSYTDLPDSYEDDEEFGISQE